MLVLIIHGSRLADEFAAKQAIEILTKHIGKRTDVHLILPDYADQGGVVGRVLAWGNQQEYHISKFDPQSKVDAWKDAHTSIRKATMFLFPVYRLINEVSSRLLGEAVANQMECHLHWLNVNFG